MNLAPVATATAPAYPERRAASSPAAGRWLRRLGVALAGSAAFWVAGCWPISDGGVVGPPSYFFECSETSPESTRGLAVPGSYEGVFCAGQNAWAEVDLEVQQTVTIGLTAGDECSAVVYVIDPDGTAIEIVEPADGDVPVALEAGRHLLAVNHAGGCEDQTFTVNVGEVEE
jgi:hypothetical protein